MGGLRAGGAGSPLGEEGERRRINHCQYSADGRELYTGGSDGCIRVWNAATGEAIREYVPGRSPRRFTSIFAFVLSRTGREVAWCGRTALGPPHQIVVSRVGNLSVKRRIPAHSAEVMILSSYQGGFCSGSVDRTVGFWSWNSDECHHSLRTRGTVRALTASSDGMRVAVGGVAIITVYSRSGHGVGPDPIQLRGHTRCIECIEFSPDGTRLASVALDGTLRLWDAATGLCLRTFAPKLGPLHWVAFAPDGLTAAFSSVRGDIGLIDLDD
jgi:WD40 repeat protein